MSIQSQITRIKNEVSTQHDMLAQVNAALVEKGAPAPDTDSASDYKYSYSVNPIAGAAYGFKKNADGYYESTNQGIDSSYSICRVNITVTKKCHIYFKVINSAQASGDYGIFGKLNVALSLTNTLDSVYEKNYRQVTMTEPYSLSYLNVEPGEYFIDVKYIKNSSVSQNNDSLQFLLEEGYEIPRVSLKNNTTAIQDILTMVGDLPEGASLPELTNPATADELFLNKELIDQNGSKVTGTFTIDDELSEMESKIAELSAILETKTAVTGADTSDATALAADIRSGKTAYADGVKLVGTIADFDGSYECSGDSTAGGGSVDTCTLTIKCAASTISPMVPTITIVTVSVYDGTQIVTSNDKAMSSTSYTLDNAVCGTHVYVQASEISATSTDGAELLHSPRTNIRIYKLTATAGETATITII